LLAISRRKQSLFKPTSPVQELPGRFAILDDAAHAFGSEWHGRMGGNIADFSSFSFHAVKNLTTAEGGALTWRHNEGVDDDEIYTQLQLLHIHGQSTDELEQTKLGAWAYDIAGTYYKCQMTDITATIGLQQFQRYPEIQARRKVLVGKYDAACVPLNIHVLPHYTNYHSSSGHLYITRVPGITLEQRNEIIVKMAEVGIACNVHYKPLPMHTAYKKLGYDINDYPNAYAQFANEITLPLHTCLKDEEVDFVISNYVRVLKEYLA